MKPTPNPTDTILTEIYQTRRMLLEKHGGVTGLAAFLRNQEAKSDCEVVKPAATSQANGPARRGKRFLNSTDREEL